MHHHNYNNQYQITFATDVLLLILAPVGVEADIHQIGRPMEPMLLVEIK